MGLFEGLEKLINERGSAAVMTQHLAFIKEKYEHLDKQSAELQIRLAKEQALLEREREDHAKTAAELTRVNAEHAEEVRIHTGIEFRRGKRTGGGWAPFCPRCHVPIDRKQGIAQCADIDCKWTTLVTDHEVARAIEALSSSD